MNCIQKKIDKLSFLQINQLFFIALVGFLTSCSNTTVSYLDNDFPGLEAELYAEGIVNDSNKFVQDLVMNSDGTEQYFALTNTGFFYLKILRIRIENGAAKLDTLKFDKNIMAVGEPKLTFDDKHLYFVGAINFPSKIWRVTRSSADDWVNPEKIDLPIDSTFNVYYPSFSKDGSMYFATWNGGENTENSGRMYRTKQNEEGEYVIHELNIPGTGSDPYIARDGSYLIFNSRKDEYNTESYGRFDLYICFKQEDGSWGKAINMGPEINTEAIDMHAFVSPDEKYLFFSRRESFTNATYSEIYWISSEIIENIRKANDL